MYMTTAEKLLEELMSSYGKYLGLASAIVGNRTDAEDVLQNCGLKMVTSSSLGHLVFNDRFHAERWIKRLVVNESINVVRERNHRSKATRSFARQLDKVNGVTDVEGMLDAQTMVLTLSVDDRALVHAWSNGLNMTEIQIKCELSCTSRTTGMKVKRVLSQLQSRFGEPKA
jgi:DNA-directed RNA polymerase specialized sigma24 family protein